MEYNIFVEGLLGDVPFSWAMEDKRFTVSDLNTQLAAKPQNTTSIKLRMNSNGGVVGQAFTMHDILAIQDIPVSVSIEGTCGSAATIVAQAPKSQGKGGLRTMLKNSEYFIHNPMFLPTGSDAYNADELKAITADLLKEESRIVDFYAPVTGKSKTSIRTRMDEAKVLDANEALSYGFIDEIVNTSINSYTKYKLVAISDTQIKKYNMEENNIIATGFSKLEKLLNTLISNTAVAPNSKKLKDGSTVYFEGEFKAGTKLFADEKLTVAATLTETEVDGNMVKVEAGAVKEITAPQAAAPDTATELAATKVELETLKAEKLAAETAKVAAETKATETENALKEVNTEFVNLKKAMTTGGMANLLLNSDGKQELTIATGLDADAERIKKAAAARK